VFKWQIWYTEMTDLLQFKIHICKSHRQLQCTLQLLCEDDVLFVLSWSSRFFYVGSSIQNANELFVSCIHIYSLKIHCSPNPTSKNLTELGPKIQTSCISVSIQNWTHVHMNFFSTQWPILSFPKNFNFHRESLCIALPGLLIVTITRNIMCGNLVILTLYRVITTRLNPLPANVENMVSSD
jgi:hypothetical protein